MNLYLFDIGEKGRRVSRFIGQVHAELQRALVFEKAVRKITQQQIATMLGVNRSVVNRQFMGLENMTLRRVAELAWALGWDIVFELRKRPTEVRDGRLPIEITRFSQDTGAALTTPPLPAKVFKRPESAQEAIPATTAA